MKQHEDTHTTEIFPCPAKRGRKPTGKAKSGAEREAGRRNRKANELAALLAEAEALKDDNAKLLANNQEMARLLEGHHAKHGCVSAMAGPLFDFFDEVGIEHQGR